jgi:hypothetical protein
LYFFYFFDFAVKKFSRGAAAGMPLFPEVIAAKRQLLAIRRRRIDGVCRRQAGRDAVLQQRKGLKRYPFLPQAKKIQA